MSMRLFLFLVAISLFAAGWWQLSSKRSSPSGEVVALNDANRSKLITLRQELKFEPHDFPPLGYTGIASPEEGAIARAAVNDTIDSILSRGTTAVSADEITKLFDRNMKRVRMLETEDRDRTWGYMVEIWYILGFKGATGQVYGSYFHPPEGYGEPLPPGWASPTRPRRPAI